jgi:hypothetical protein
MLRLNSVINPPNPPLKKEGTCRSCQTIFDNRYINEQLKRFSGHAQVEPGPVEMGRLSSTANPRHLDSRLRGSVTIQINNYFLPVMPDLIPAEDGIFDRHPAV